MTNKNDPTSNASSERSKKSTQLFMHFLQKKYNRQEEEASLPFLSDDLLGKETQERHHFPVSPTDFLKKIHYSWWKEVIHSFPASLQAALVGILPSGPRERLAEAVGLSDDIPLPTPIGKSFLQALLSRRLTERKPTPTDQNLSSLLVPLVSLEKEEILRVIDYLGLFDIAEEIVHIVDRKNLAALYACLSPRKRQFLKQSLQYKERVSLSKLGLENWNGDKKRLDKAIHQRGLFRFGTALQGEDPSILWSIYHRIDIGRAKILERLQKDTVPPRVREILRRELNDVITFLQLGSSS